MTLFGRLFAPSPVTPTKQPYSDGTPKAVNKIRGLEVKIANLVDEAKVIRSKERKELTRGRMLAVTLRLDAGELSEIQRDRILARFKRRVGKPYTEFRPSTKIEDSWVTESYQTYHYLQQHRVGIVRNEARAAYLAYGFLRGRPYNVVETVVRSRPNLHRVEQLVLKFGAGTPQELKQRFQEWLDAAR